jgi:hypothetical protein
MYRRKVTAATLRRRQLEHRGEGTGSLYVPGVQVRRSDTPSNGRSSVEINPELGRQHDLLTKFQSGVCLLLRRLDTVKDILENFPFPLDPTEHPGQRWSLEKLTDTAGSVAIAAAKRLRHPVHPDADDRPRQLITPLLVAVQANEDAELNCVAIVLNHGQKPPEPLPTRKADRLLFECWEAIDVEVLTYYRSELTEVVQQNHIWLSEAALFGPEVCADPDQIRAFVECALRADWSSQSAYQVLGRIAVALRIAAATSIALYKHSLWFNHLSTDLTRPLWRLVTRHGQPTTDARSLPDWHPLSKSRWLA